MKKNKLKLLTLLSVAFLFTFILSACSASKDESVVINEIINNENEPARVELDLEMMSIEEKEFLGIDANLNIQVLSRDEEGVVSSYKQVNSDEDLFRYHDEIEALLQNPSDNELVDERELEEAKNTDLIIE